MQNLKSQQADMHTGLQLYSYELMITNNARLLDQETLNTFGSSFKFVSYFKKDFV